MPVLREFNSPARSGDVPVKIFTRDIFVEAVEQLKNTAALPIVGPHIAAMPDVDVGSGATVGSVNAIIPAAVGVDIGCGMNALQLSLRSRQLPDGLGPLRSAIERAVPVVCKLIRQPG